MQLSASHKRIVGGAAVAYGAYRMFLADTPGTGQNFFANGQEAGYVATVTTVAQQNPGWLLLNVVLIGGGIYLLRG